MAFRIGGEFEPQHPVATGFDRQNLSTVALTHQSQKSSTSVPRTRKERAPDTGNPLVAPPITATDKQALVGIRKAYNGGKKPALVLSFRQNGSGVWVCHLGDARIELHQAGLNDTWVGFLVARKRHQLLRGNPRIGKKTGEALPNTTPVQAARALVETPGWFYHMGEWRALAWVYSAIQFEGLGHVDYPESFEIGLKSGDNLHVSGSWCWQPHSGRKVRIAANIKLPNNAGLSRTPRMGDIRNEMSFIQDVDKHGRLSRKRVGNKWVLRAPENPYEPGAPRPAPALVEIPPYTGGIYQAIVKGTESGMI